MIDNPSPWFTFSEARNQVARTYNEKNAKYVYDAGIKFLLAVKVLLKELDQNND